MIVTFTAAIIAAGSTFLSITKQPVATKAVPTSVSFSTTAQGWTNNQVIDEFDIDTNWNVRLSQKVELHHQLITITVQHLECMVVALVMVLNY